MSDNQKRNAMRERREFVRIPANLRIFYKVLPNTATRQSFTKDISQGGVRFFAYEPIPKKSILEIRVIDKKSHLFINGTARIRWIKDKLHCGRYEVGIGFINISEESMQFLFSYISNSQKKIINF